MVASATWTPSGGVHNQIKYVALAAPVTLAPNTQYYLASQEEAGGDRWYNHEHDGDDDRRGGGASAGV